MKIKKVKVTSIDGDFGGRTLEIKTDKKDLETPNRAISSTEIGYKKDVGCAEAFDNELYDAVASFEHGDIAKLHKKNGYYGEKRKNISAKIRELEEDALTRIHIQEPYCRSVEYEDKDLKSIVELQMDVKPDFIELPDPSPNSQPEIFEKKMLELAKQVNARTMSVPCPVIDMGLEAENFKQKYKVVLDNVSTFPTLGIVYRSFDECYPNYTYLWNNRDKDLWIHAVGVNRWVGGRSKDYLALMHKLQWYGIDTCTRLTKKAFPGGITKPRRFDGSSLGIIPLPADHRTMHGESLNCNCPVCKNLDLKKYITKYSYNLKGDYNLNTLNQWNQIHEVFDSTREFKISRESIKKSELKEYCKTKKFWHLKEKSP